jgi:hypothetical protein
MGSTVCGLCNVDWHLKGYGQIWIEGVGLHRWQEPTKEQITQRLRKKYGLV